MSTAEFRASAPLFDTKVLPASNPPTLGDLEELPGTWVGEGFNLVSLPDFQNHLPFQVKLARTTEHLEFKAIGASIPNRGNLQNDIEYLGVHYLQQVNDANDHSALHLEPGLWLNLPLTTAPAEPKSIVRQSTIPHGDSLLAIGSSFVLAPSQGPQIAVANSTPTNVSDGTPITNPAYLKILQDAPLPKGFSDRGIISDPNIILRNDIKNQTIVQTTVLTVDTKAPGTAAGILNIPFIVANANAISMNAIFWIEKVKASDGRTFMQLQYTQTVILQFNNINWPHISVATLVKR